MTGSETAIRQNVGIVIPAYRRPAELHRLLTSVAVAQRRVGAAWPTIVSIDGGDPAVVDVARSFSALPLDIRVKEKRLGLRAHILACGDLTRDFDAILVLEDDLILAPQALIFVEQALAPSMRHPLVAALSLYSFKFNEFASYETMRSEVVGDVFYAMTGSSWGQVWWREKWSDFRAWLEDEFDPARYYHVPERCRNWSANSWKKYFNMYLSARGFYSAAPLYSQALNPGSDTGTHITGIVGPWLSEASAVRKRFLIRPPEETMRLDAFLEYETDDCHEPIEGVDIPLSAVEFDLTGGKTRRDIRKPYVMTRRRQPSALAEFDASLANPLLAILAGIGGKGLSLVRAEAFDDRGELRRNGNELRQHFPWLVPRALVRLAFDVGAARVRSGLWRR